MKSLALIATMFFMVSCNTNLITGVTEPIEEIVKRFVTGTTEPVEEIVKRFITGTTEPVEEVEVTKSTKACVNKDTCK